MPHHPHRRTLLLGAAGFALTALTYRAKAQSEVVQGRLTFAGDAKIPKGRISISLSNPGQPDTSDPALEFDLISTGRAKRIDFTLSSAALSALSPTLQVVARLERADGWLIARGSTRLAAGARLDITLNTVMY
ncbi:hypothetical protein [Phaeobacter gallaeciensis]|uniref:Uncharacterized protein n=1 Tax=Phaeobacter gallaeciensis TaxID=60890 RepID=A0AAC9Z6V9_9RHOB|nr:hypothetical protein [Phaeobacter gallaeciensis]AHD08602.1 hypothetical protein Gal_00820 [Phaeobacter gallaeciensis DSM 26640]ATE91868.1 hypothetical protein PhaeoP11_00816 [Phaeobacter gallaeciensis]ATE98308.1 hypothetical protein PhaeoP73_03028 [Phaeobacter gallaeciensis]ATF00484.1 hypothetical protein PhaeoP75_00817 [Phaeobacter gallaeciensis]ATF04915.1 hypothetical protein PhaeoP63_00816 [Phaeobacter gallaeciensis]